MKNMSLGLLAIMTALSFLATSAYSFGDRCRHYVGVPVTVALSNGKAAALLYSRFYNHNRFRGNMGPHQRAVVLHPRRKCSTKRGRRRTLK